MPVAVHTGVMAGTRVNNTASIPQLVFFIEHTNRQIEVK
jgi:hypothetical protein